MTKENLSNENLTKENTTNEKLTNEKLTNEKLTNEKITNESIIDSMGLISDDLIEQADRARSNKTARSKKHSFMSPKWVAAAACLLLFLAVGIPALNSDNSSPGENNLTVNQLDSMNMTNLDMDVQYHSHEHMPKAAWQAVLNGFQKNTGMSYEDFTSSITSCGWELSEFYSLYAPDISSPGPQDPQDPQNQQGQQDHQDQQGQQGPQKEYKFHDYVFRFTAEGEATATIAICPFEKPLRDCFFETDNPKESQINGTSLEIYGFQNYYTTQFSHGGINYDIEANNITLDELEDLLSNVMSKK